jgi:hypothetical protein
VVSSAKQAFQKLAQRHREVSSMTVATCKRIALHIPVVDERHDDPIQAAPSSTRKAGVKRTQTCLFAGKN